MANDAPADLGLLQTFEALYRERHLTRAATRLGRSQPALSRSLARLRRMFGDDLFLRTPRGMVPTPRADALAPEVTALLERARALVTPARFIPERLRRTFVIATTDFTEQFLADGVVRALAFRAPEVSVTFRPIVANVWELLGGSLDLVVGPKTSMPGDAMSQHLFDDSFICAVRKQNPHVRGRLSLERFVELAHVQIAPEGQPGGPLDDALTAAGLSRRIAVRTYSFLSAPLLVSKSDLVLTGPSRVLMPLARTLQLRTFPPPVQLPGFSIYQAWHARAQRDPAHAWFRALVAEVAKGR